MLILTTSRSRALKSIQQDSKPNALVPFLYQDLSIIVNEQTNL